MNLSVATVGSNSTIEVHQRRPIPRIELADDGEFLNLVAHHRTPAIVTGLMNQWPAARMWSPDWFAAQYGSFEFMTSVNLPTSGISYDLDWAEHVKPMTMRDFVDSLQDFDRPAYVRRQEVRRLPGLERDVRFMDMVDGEGFNTQMFVWFGTANTRTGLHFDFQDGVLAQFHGRKQVLMVAPEESRCVYPIADSITKSAVCADAPDFDAHPRFRDVTLWEGVIGPGEMVFLPRCWWHAINALDVSISSSFNWGQKITWSEIAAAIQAGGASHWTRVTRDFVYHGLLHRPYRTRMFDDPPFGKLLYDLVAQAVARRLT